jgi:aryl-alcohol dehydrogenase-like predicted oxidoreductase
VADRLFTTETAHVDVADRASIDALAAAAQLGPLGPLRSDGQPDRLGTMNFRHTVDESSSFAVMDAAIDAGINFFDVALALCAASARHILGLTCEQSLYNPAVRAVELELIPALRSLGIGLIPYSPLHAGLLAGVLETATEGGIFDDSTQQRIAAHRNQLEAYEGLRRKLGAKPAEEVALAWLLRNPVVSTTIVGATTIEELQSDLDALTVQLDAIFDLVARSTVSEGLGKCLDQCGSDPGQGSPKESM